MIEIYKICTHCNKEFKCPVSWAGGENESDAIYNFSNCPHCGERNDAWVRIVSTSSVYNGEDMVGMSDEDMLEQDREKAKVVDSVFDHTVHEDASCLCQDKPGSSISKDNELYDADPDCDHNIVGASGGGVKCTKCTGWFCF